MGLGLIIQDEDFGTYGVLRSRLAACVSLVCTSKVLSIPRVQRSLQLLGGVVLPGEVVLRKRMGLRARPTDCVAGHTSVPP